MSYQFCDWMAGRGGRSPLVFCERQSLERGVQSVGMQLRAAVLFRSSFLLRVFEPEKPVIEIPTVKVERRPDIACA